MKKELSKREREVTATLVARRHNQLLKSKLRKDERESERAMELADLKAICRKLRGEDA